MDSFVTVDKNKWFIKQLPLQGLIFSARQDKYCPWITFWVLDQWIHFQAGVEYFLAPQALQAFYGVWLAFALYQETWKERSLIFRDASPVRPKSSLDLFAATSWKQSFSHQEAHQGKTLAKCRLFGYSREIIHSPLALLKTLASQANSPQILSLEDAHPDGPRQHSRQIIETYCLVQMLDLA